MESWGYEKKEWWVVRVSDSLSLSLPNFLLSLSTAVGCVHGCASALVWCCLDPFSFFPASLLHYNVLHWTSSDGVIYVVQCWVETPAKAPTQDCPWGVTPDGVLTDWIPLVPTHFLILVLYIFCGSCELLNFSSNKFVFCKANVGCNQGPELLQTLVQCVRSR